MEVRSLIWKFNRASRAVLLTLVIATLASCAHVKNPDDPLEPFNRTMYKINHNLDTLIFHPLAFIYHATMPNFAKRGVNNFFYNFYEPTRIINFLLRAEFNHALEHTGRFFVNTTVGIGGLFDIASARMNLPRRRSDLGMTLAKWGFRESTFLYVPIFGPTTFRDGIGYLIDIYAFSPWPRINPPSLVWTLYGVELLHRRAKLLPTDSLIEEAIDPYAFIRDAWLQKRRSELRQVIDDYYQDEDPFIEDLDEEPLGSDPIQ